MKIAWERRGEGPSLLLIQGLGYGRWGWEPVLDLLARSFDVLAFDNRGIGESEVPAGPYTAAAMAADAIQVLDEAEVEQTHVLGTSLGGMIAQELTLAQPRRVRKLVLACTTPGGSHAFPLPEGTLRLLEEAPMLPQEVALRRFVVSALAADADAELVERIMAHRLAAPQPLDGWQAQAAAGTTYDGADRIGSIAAPTLVLHGEEDAVVDPRNAELLASLIPHASVERFSGAGHLFFWEQPERFAEVVTGFLR
jgi:3-oxoadipate enol-lactonase